MAAFIATQSPGETLVQYHTRQLVTVYAMNSPIDQQPWRFTSASCYILEKKTIPFPVYSCQESFQMTVHPYVCTDWKICSLLVFYNLDQILP